MVEVVDTTDLKSVSPNGECGFESHSEYQCGELHNTSWNYVTLKKNPTDMHL